MHLVPVFSLSLCHISSLSSAVKVNEIKAQVRKPKRKGEPIAFFYSVADNYTTNPRCERLNSPYCLGELEPLSRNSSSKFE